MLKTGQQHLESLRDGRKVYIGDELVEDVTTHPAFRNAAESFAMIYDRKRDPENVDVMAYEDDDGEICTSWYLKPKSKIHWFALNTSIRVLMVKPLSSKT